MRWYYRRAKIDPHLRETFEVHGVGTMQNLLAAPDRPFVHEEMTIDANRVRIPLLQWLKEQYDRAEAKETWSLTMEIAITLLVALELAFMVAR